MPPTLEHMNVDRKWLKKTGGDQSWKKTLKKKGLGMYGELHEVVMKSQRYGDDGGHLSKIRPTTEQSGQRPDIPVTFFNIYYFLCSYR